MMRRRSFQDLSAGLLGVLLSSLPIGAAQGTIGFLCLNVYDEQLHEQYPHVQTLEFPSTVGESKASTRSKSKSTTKRTRYIIAKRHDRKTSAAGID